MACCQECGVPCSQLDLDFCKEGLNNPLIKKYQLPSPPHRQPFFATEVFPMVDFPDGLFQSVFAMEIYKLP